MGAGQCEGSDAGRLILVGVGRVGMAHHQNVVAFQPEAPESLQECIIVEWLVV